MPPYIASLDVGTTSVRCFIFNEKCEIKGTALELVKLLNPQPGYFEIEPDALWRSIVNVISNAIKDAKLLPSDITCLGLSTQRCTFLTWNHRTNEYYHNFITWKDLRANALVDEWNSGCILKTLNVLSYGLYLLTRSKRFLAGSVIKMMNGQVSLRLLYEIQNNARLGKAIKNKTARVETLDSWMLYKLRTGNTINTDVEHISDITSCTATGIFDPFTLSWSQIILFLLGIKSDILPKVVDNTHNFGYVHPSIFGDNYDGTIRITSSVSDQTASMWGSNCFKEADVKVTMGTGAFLDLITGQHCHASVMGIYPLVAWNIPPKSHSKYDRDGISYCMEGSTHDMGTVITWAQSCGLITDPAETSDIATSVEDTNGVYFVPAFSGLGPPLNDCKAASGFLGITPSTTRAHLIRALLESIAFRVAQLCETMQKETNYTINALKVDGGVSRNNFVCQFLADVSGIVVERAINTESSVIGSAFIAGINCEIWRNHEEIRKFRVIDRIFKPCTDQRRLQFVQRMHVWKKAIERFTEWY